MGEASRLLNILCRLSTSDWVNAFGVAVNAGLAIWIVRAIQDNLNNRRVLKDHFICEVKDLRNSYKEYLNNLHGGKTLPQSITPWFKLMNIKVNDLMVILNKKYRIQIDNLLPYQTTLPELITDSEEFIRQFMGDKPVKFSEETKKALIRFQQEHNQRFNDLIILINDAK